MDKKRNCATVEWATTKCVISEIGKTRIEIVMKRQHK